MKRFFSICVLILAGMTAGAAANEADAPRGWLRWATLCTDTQWSGPEELPVCCRIELTAGFSPALAVTDGTGKRIALCGEKGRKREVHRYIVEIDPDATDPHGITVRHYIDGEVISTRKLKATEHTWQLEGFGDGAVEHLRVYVREPNHRIVAPQLDFSEQADRFIGDLIAEVHGFGFEQVCLSAVQFPPMVSSRQNFGETGGLGRDGQLAADIAVWEERFAGEVTLWYEYPLASCTDVSPALGALPAQLGARNLVVSLPAGEAADPAALTDLAARMKEQGCAYVVVRDSERGSFY